MCCSMGTVSNGWWRGNHSRHQIPITPAQHRAICRTGSRRPSPCHRQTAAAASTAPLATTLCSPARHGWRRRGKVRKVREGCATPGVTTPLHGEEAVSSHSPLGETSIPPPRVHPTLASELTTPPAHLLSTWSAGQPGE